MRKFLVFVITLSLVFPYFVWAADVEEPFTGYSASLEGENGGTGWGNAWQDGPRTADFQVVTTNCQAGDCVNADGTSDIGDDRNYTTAIINGTISFYGNQVSGESTGEVLFKTTGDVALFQISFVRVGVDSSVRLIGATSATIGTWTGNTWQLVEIETEAAGTCAANEVRARFAGGAFSSCIAYSNAGDTQQLELLRDYSGIAGGDFRVDTFSASAIAAAGAAVAEQEWFFQDF